MSGRPLKLQISGLGTIDFSPLVSQPEIYAHANEHTRARLRAVPRAVIARGGTARFGPIRLSGVEGVSPG